MAKPTGRRASEVWSEVPLALGRIERLDGRWSRVAVDCRSGCCWITVDGDSADYVLHAGQRREWTDVRGPIIVMGASAEDARVHLVARPRVSRWARLLR